MGSACYPSASYSSLPSCYYFAFPVDPKSTEMMQRELGVSAVRRLEFGRSLRHLSWLPSGPANAIVNRRYPECLRRDYTKHHLLACCTRLMTILLWSAGSRARMWKNLMKGSAIYEQLRKEWCYHRAPGHHSERELLPPIAEKYPYPWTECLQHEIKLSTESPYCVAACRWCRPKIHHRPYRIGPMLLGWGTLLYLSRFGIWGVCHDLGASRTETRVLAEHVEDRPCSRSLSPRGPAHAVPRTK